VKFVATEKGMKNKKNIHPYFLLLFLDRGSGMGKNQDPRSGMGKNQDPGSGMGKNQDPGSGINIDNI
jgi:hypothetical protein